MKRNEPGTPFPLRRPRPNARVRLVCLPFAGGSAAVYADWATQLPDDVDVCAVELPGHGARFRETPVEDPSRLVDDLAAALARLPELPVVVFGHSLGGAIAFALARAGIRADALVSRRAAVLAEVRRVLDATLAT